jgi:hypothetical protein
MNTEKYREFNLPSSVNGFIVDRLDWNRTLSQTLLHEKDTSTCKKTTFLPANTCIEAISNYDYGGITSCEQSVKWLVGKIQEFLSSETNRLVLFQDALAESTDPCIQRIHLPILTYCKEVYFWLSNDNSKQPELIREVLKNADDHFLVGIMSSLPEPHARLTSNLNIDLIKILAKRTEHIFVSAFDEEGYIICSLKH